MIESIMFQTVPRIQKKTRRDNGQWRFLYFCTAKQEGQK